MEVLIKIYRVPDMASKIFTTLTLKFLPCFIRFFSNLEEMSFTKSFTDLPVENLFKKIPKNENLSPVSCPRD